MTAILGILGIGCLALAGWSAWLLQRHWPKSAWDQTREQMVMMFSAYRKGRDGIPPIEALSQMEAELSAAKQRADMELRAERFVAEQTAMDDDLDRPQTVAVMGDTPEI